MNTFPPRLPWAEMYVRSGLKSLSDRMRQQSMVRRVRGAVADVRTTVRDVARNRIPEATSFVERVMKKVLAEPERGPSTLINATGVIAPRGLALPLSDHALAAMAGAGEGYATAASASADTLLGELSGAPAALVLHSPSIAVIAVLSTLGGDVVLACDHAVEIDGSPITRLAAAAGVQLAFVGSTGRVSREDYRAALADEESACVWHALQPSLAICGDVCAPARDEVFAIARDAQAISVAFLEGASLEAGTATENPWPADVSRAVTAGADLTIFSGERMLGGPSCGIVVGRSELVSLIAEHPLALASKLEPGRLAALAATLELAKSAEGRAAIPLVQLLSASTENLKNRSERLSVLLSGCEGVSAAEAVSCRGWATEGSLPTQQMDSWGVSITPRDASAEELLQKLVDGRPSLAATICDGRLLLNLRSVLARQDGQISAVFGSKADLPLL